MCTQTRRLRLRGTTVRCGGALLVLCLLLPLAATAGDAADPCAGFTWDVKHERALFGAKPQSLAAGKAAASAPALTADHLYELELIALPQITFAVPPGRHPASDTVYGGTRHVDGRPGGPLSRLTRSVVLGGCARGRRPDRRAGFSGTSRLQRPAQDRRVRAAGGEAVDVAVERRRRADGQGRDQPGAAAASLTSVPRCSRDRARSCGSCR